MAFTISGPDGLDTIPGLVEAMLERAADVQGVLAPLAGRSSADRRFFPHPAVARLQHHGLELQQVRRGMAAVYGAPGKQPPEYRPAAGDTARDLLSAWSAAYRATGQWAELNRAGVAGAKSAVRAWASRRDALAGPATDAWNGLATQWAGAYGRAGQAADIAAPQEPLIDERKVPSWR